MVASPANLHYRSDIALDAAQRWQSRTKKTGQPGSPDKGQYTRAETKDRLAKHVNRLLDSVASAAPVVSGGRSLQALPVGDQRPRAVHQSGFRDIAEIQIG